MSDYSQHLISMAGGDGDALDQIQARHDEQATYSWPGLAHEAHLDRTNLLTMVREQRAVIERVEAVSDKWWANFPSKARAIRDALTEGATK